MPPDFLNLLAALALALCLFGLQATAIPAIDVLWQRMPGARRQKAVDVMLYLFGKPTDPVDTLALVLFCTLAAGFALSAVGATLPMIVMLLILALAIPLFFYSRASSQRARELEMALPLALQQVANEMAAGATLETSLKRVAKSAPPSSSAITVSRLLFRAALMFVLSFSML